MDIELLNEMLEALDAMIAEFRALDLPYGSKAYCKATTARNKLYNYISVVEEE